MFLTHVFLCAVLNEAEESSEGRVRLIIRKIEKKMQETNMGGLQVNIMPVTNVFSQCLLKANNRKHSHFQEVKQ